MTVSAPPPPNRNHINRSLTFQGVGQTSGHRATFSVMVGDNPPVITTGYAKYNTLDRPLQRGLTIFAGYDPMGLTVEVRFGVWHGRDWATDDATGAHVERDIGYLEWMGGANFGGGPPPIVYLHAYSTRGRETNLIPAPAGNGRPWIIPGVTWGTAWRNSSGYRVWQDATVTLQSYLNVSPPPRPGTHVTGTYVASTPARASALQLAATPNVRPPNVDHQTLARRILDDPRNNPVRDSVIHLSGRSVSWPIPPALAVWVPYAQGSNT